MGKTVMKWGGAVALLLLVSPALAQEVLFDQGPSTGTYNGCWSNYTESQNFAEQSTLDSDATLEGVVIWTCIGPVSGTLHVKILDDAGGQPGSYLYEQDVTADSWDPDGSLYRVAVSITPFDMTAGVTYWVGVSGNGFELGQASVLTPGDGTMAQFSGRAFGFHTAVGDQMYQLIGNFGPPVARCIYEVHKVKLMADECGHVCDACDYTVGDLVCTNECPNGGADCRTRLKGFNACGNGGACKVIADLVGCDIPPQNCKRCR
ncbi:MAG: hypothetical protein IT449_05460 [Phycisphaerales bacterium]|nr:hypothetical protein [Phycisphaerales bacterium]